jgi:hypothetical protein
MKCQGWEDLELREKKMPRLGGYGMCQLCETSITDDSLLEQIFLCFVLCIPSLARVTIAFMCKITKD